MDPRRVLTFRAVAHERSFSAAARTLALTQPAVSQQVAALETELGARLLDREPGGLRLTPAGEVLLVHADALADRLGLAERQLAELAGEERARLRIGAFPSALAALVPRAVARLEKRGSSGGGAGRRGEAGGGAGGRRGETGGGAGGRRGEAGGSADPEVLVVEGETVALAERVRRGELHLAIGFQ